MSLGLLRVLVLLGALQSLVNAQSWTTPDGFLSLTPPAEKTFQALPNLPPQFHVLWISQDQSTKLGVMQVQLPSPQKLIQAAMEEGLADEIGGKVTRLPTRIVAGHEVLAMTAMGPQFACTQAIIQDQNQLYKVMAITIGTAADQQAVDQFIGSIAISKPAAPPAAVPPTPPKDGKLDLHQISKTAGGVGLILGIGLVVYFAMRRKPSQPA